MTDYILPPGLPVASMSMGYADVTSKFQNPFSGLTRTVSRPGAPWRMSLDLRNLSSTDRVRFMSWLAGMRGAANRVFVPVPGYTRRGSFPAPELLTNNDFSNGTTGWTTTNATFTVADRVARLTATTPAANVEIYRSATFEAYVPYVFRSMLIDSPQTVGLAIGRYLGFGSVSDYSTSRGLGSISGVSLTAGAASIFPAVFSSVSGFTAGAFLDIPWASAARCALVDNAPNALTYSDQFDNSAWTKSAVTVTANTGTAPDGTATAESILETATTAQHFLAQSATKAAAAQDWEFKIAVRSGLTRGFAWFEIDDGTGSNSAIGYVNLTTGAITNTAVAGTFTNLRTFSGDMGNSWWYLSVIVRTGAGTTIRGVVGPATAAGTNSYAGNTSNGIYAWRGGLAQSSVPSMLSLTVASALPSGTAQTGSGLYLKGLPVSTSGLLLPGDYCEINTGELHMVAASLNSDAAGLGYLQLTRAVRSSPADSSPVIVNNPMAKMILNSDQQGWSTQPGIFSDSTVQFDEAA